MANDYLLTEDGFKILLEDSSGALLLESSDGGGAPPDDGILLAVTKITHIRSLN